MKIKERNKKEIDFANALAGGEGFVELSGVVQMEDREGSKIDFVFTKKYPAYDGEILGVVVTNSDDQHVSAGTLDREGINSLIKNLQELIA